MPMYALRVRQLASQHFSSVHSHYSTFSNKLVGLTASSEAAQSRFDEAQAEADFLAAELEYRLARAAYRRLGDTPAGFPSRDCRAACSDSASARSATSRSTSMPRSARPTVLSAPGAPEHLQARD